MSSKYLISIVLTFNVFLKVWTDGDFLISDCNLFQTNKSVEVYGDIGA